MKIVDSVKWANNSIFQLYVREKRVFIFSKIVTRSISLLVFALKAITRETSQPQKYYR